MSAGLTDVEIECVEKLGECAKLFARIMGDGRTRAHDLAEVVDKIHQLQHTAMSQAAARAHPELFRLLGESVSR